MSDINDWLQLASTWQAQPVDLPALQRRTRWHTLWLYSYTAFEMAIVLLIWAMAIYYQWIKPLPLLWQVWAWLGALFAPVMTWFNIRARAGTWRVRDNSVRGLLELKRRRAQVALTLIRYSDRLIPFGVALGWLWNGLSVWWYPTKLAWWQAYTGATLVTLILGLWLLICRRRARIERRTVAETESLLQDLA